MDPPRKRKDKVLGKTYGDSGAASEDLLAVVSLLDPSFFFGVKSIFSMGSLGRLGEGIFLVWGSSGRPESAGPSFINLLSKRQHPVTSNFEALER